MAHIDISLRIVRIQHILNMHNLINQLEHSIILGIFQRLADRAFDQNTGNHVGDRDDHQDARQQENYPHRPARKSIN